MKIDDVQDPRFSLALDRLYDGFTFDFDDLNFWLPSKESDSMLEVRVKSHWNLQNVTEQTALSDIENGKQKVASLESVSSEFAKLIRKHRLQFVLINDYGNGAVEICRLVGDNLIWMKGFQTFP